MNTAPDMQPPRAGRRLRIVLFTSLAFNLLVVGLMIGVMIAHGFGRDSRPPRMDQVGGPMTRALSEADRHALGREMRHAYRDRRADRAGIRAEFEQIITALERKPYDPEAVRTSLERQMEVMAEGARLGRELLLERLESMSDAEREAYAERLREALERKTKPGKDRSGRRWQAHSER
ncbi:MAG: Heavy-metal resistance [Rhodobacteraceae bacterium HLUCCO07]|nr:MAG: Heavy-metal resistance [Rhodobacteraceae bacterium HLUCCO07]